MVRLGYRAINAAAWVLRQRALAPTSLRC